MPKSLNLNTNIESMAIAPTVMMMIMTVVLCILILIERVENMIDIEVSHTEQATTNTLLVKVVNIQVREVGLTKGLRKTDIVIRIIITEKRNMVNIERNLMKRLQQMETSGQKIEKNSKCHGLSNSLMNLTVKTVLMNLQVMKNLTQNILLQNITTGIPQKGIENKEVILQKKDTEKEIGLEKNWKVIQVKEE